MSWAKVGAKCVCVDDSVAPYMGDRLIKGTVYTVIGFCGPDYTGAEGVVLKEVKSDYPFGRGYRVERFRPIVTKTQSEDVAMFKRIADQVSNMEDVA